MRPGSNVTVPFSAQPAGGAGRWSLNKLQQHSGNSRPVIAEEGILAVCLLSISAQRLRIVYASFIYVYSLFLSFIG
jgi:hypothetical protein